MEMLCVSGSRSVVPARIHPPSNVRNARTVITCGAAKRVLMPSVKVDYLSSPRIVRASVLLLNRLSSCSYGVPLFPNSEDGCLFVLEPEKELRRRKSRRGVCEGVGGGDLASDVALPGSERLGSHHYAEEVLESAVEQVAEYFLPISKDFLPSTEQAFSQVTAASLVSSLDAVCIDQALPSPHELIAPVCQHVLDSSPPFASFSAATVDGYIAGQESDRQEERGEMECKQASQASGGLAFLAWLGSSAPVLPHSVGSIYF
eukprot:TRINITY_DN8705_c0_g1_i1.p1 TRINITY_DN8705_c0_g1~~TRINITY_DN8705_c0_g1_i1.p1  ORF type:complete len:260 (-),score=20.94 TRINITY_DN8705_c0_g1_i1:688-1467(-)